MTAPVISDNGASGRLAARLRRLDWTPLIAFAVTALLFCLVAAASNVYPFGSESFLTEDLKFQYVDLFTWYKKVLTGGESVLYSFSPSLGSNAWGVWSYYLASPFNLLILLFPDSLLTLAVFVITLLKLGLAGATAAFYLRRRFSLRRCEALALALCLSCSLWMMTQLRNPMWMDAMILLPLAAHGAWRCVTRGRWAELLVTLVAAVITCWYMGYMLVMFSVCCSWVEWYVAPADGAGRVPGTRAVSLVCGVFCFVVLLSAWTLYPTVVVQLGSWSALRGVVLVAGSVVLLALGLLLLGDCVPGRVVRVVACAVTAMVLAVLALMTLDVVARNLEGGLLGVLRSLSQYGARNLVSSPFLGTYQVNESPQLYVGYLPLLGAVLLLVDCRMDRRFRLAAAAFLVVCLVSVAFVPVYLAWCGFRAPNGFNSRTAFLFVFASVWAAGAYLGGRRVQGLPRCALVLVVALAAVVLGSLSVPVHSLRAIVVSVVLVVLYVALLMPRAYRLGLVLPLAVFAELTFSGCLAWPSLYVGYSQDAHEAYVADASHELESLRMLDDGFYRVEKTYTRAGQVALNEGFSQGFNRLSSYLSSTGHESVDLLNALGYSNPGEFSTSYLGPILPSDSLLGVRYVFSRVPLNGLRQVGGTWLADGDLLYENPDALSVGYAASSDVMATDVVGSDNPFEAQNRLASAVLGQDVELFRPLDSEVVVDGGGFRSWEVEVPAGVLACSWASDPAGSRYRYSVKGGGAAWADDVAEEDTAWDGWRFGHAVRTLNEVSDVNREVVVTLTSEAAAVGDDNFSPTCLFYGLDLSVYRQLVDDLSAQQLQVAQWSHARLSGSVRLTGEKNGLLLTVPYDLGWTVRVNGGRVDAQSAFDGTMTFVPVTGAGDFELDMTYVPPMLREGVCVTGVFAVVLAVAVVASKRKRVVTRA